MTDTKAEENQLVGDKQIEEANNDSDAESLDSEGYSKHDPYAAQAKKIDRQKAA